MKKILFFAVFVTFIFSAMSLVIACTHPSDSFAAEVLLNKQGIDYHLSVIENSENVLARDNGEYIFKSRSEELYTILKEVGEKLSVRIQIPIRTEYVKQDYTRIKNTIKSDEFLTNLTGWDVQCSYSSCVFNKDELSVMTNEISDGKYSVTVEIQKETGKCGSTKCDGRCLYYAAENFCVPNEYINELKEFVTATKLAASVDSILNSAEIERQSYQADDLIPELEMEIDWKEAMKNELTFLKSSAVIGITDKDIAEISELAARGQAGDNLKILYGEDRDGKKRWLYYYETKSPIIQKPLDCEDYPLSELPNKYIVFNKNAEAFYYAIPAALIAGVVALFFILLVVSRIMENRKNHRHPVESPTK